MIKVILRNLALRLTTSIFVACLLTATSMAKASASGPGENRYLQMSIQELMQVKITSVSKKEEKLLDAPAAVFVISDEDILRSGATTIPEALRMAPGVNVAKIDSNKWAISIRGFNGRFSNKLLVLIDGRSVYSPIFSGVFWNLQDLLLEDIDRIEIIRGPGATLWGANAVNGVINIITKNAKDTQGVLMKAQAGTEERGLGGFRFGGKIGENTYYRVYAKAFERDSQEESSGREGADDWDYVRTGFRLDSRPSEHNNVTIEGDIYDGTIGTRALLASLLPPYSETLDIESDTSGGSFLGRWTHTFVNSSQFIFQTYFSRDKSKNPTLEYTTDKYDLDLQYRFKLGHRQELTLGFGYRHTRTDTEAGLNTSFDPEIRDDDLVSGFVQNEIQLIPGRLYLTLGSKFEHNDYSGFEYQPGGRMLWRINDNHSLWASISRAVRTPSIAESDATFKSHVIAPSSMNPLPTLVLLKGNRDIDSEKLMAYELGYKGKMLDWLSVDLALFFNSYDDLVTIEPLSTTPSFSPLPIPHMEYDMTDKNMMDGETYGLELAMNMKLTDWWRLSGAYTYTRLFLHRDSDSSSTNAEEAEKETPEHQFSLRSSMNLPENLGLDLWFRYTDDLAAQNVPSYFTIDTHISWQPTKNFEISFTGRNLLDSRHPEFSPEIYGMVPTEVERSFYGKIVLHF